MRRRRIVVAAATAVSIVSAGAWGGGVAAVAVLILLLPILAFAFDNRTGAFFILAVLMTISFIVLTALLSLMAIGH